MTIKKVWFGFLAIAMAFGLIAAAACGSEQAASVVVEKEVIVEKEVAKEVVVEVEKEVVVEVEKEVVVEVEKEVVVEKEVLVEVAKTGPEITGVAKKGGTLIWGSPGDHGGMHPQQNFAHIVELATTQMYESLVERNWLRASPEYEDTTPAAGPIGKLAESWELSEDKLTWTFHLRKGIKFHDGTDWNAEVAEMNFRSLIDEDYEFFNPVGSAHTGFTMSHVESVRAVDEFTFEIRLLKPLFGFIDKLASYPCCGLVSGKAIQTMTPEEINSGGPTGTGAFKFVSWERGEKLVMERYEDYWGENALLDELIFVPIVDEAVRVAALLSGEIDVTGQISPDNLGLVVGQEGFKGYIRGISGQYALNPNHREPPFSDQRVRRAASLCIDRRELADTLMKGVHKPGAQIYGASHEGKDPAGRQITDEYDPELARELLAEAGYPDGIQTKMYSSIAGGLGVPELVVNSFIVISLRECGIEVELINFEWLTYIALWTGGISQNQGIGFFTINMGAADLGGFDQYLHSSGWPPAGWSIGWYDNADVDVWVEKAWNASNYEEYLTAEREAHRLALDDYAYIPVLELRYTFAMSDRVGGFTGATDWISKFDRAFVEYER